MSRLVDELQEWPIAARVASVALLAAVLLLAIVTTLLGVATRHAGASPTTTTTLGSQQAAVPDGLPVPSSTSTSTTSTTPAPGSPASATSSTMPSTVAGTATASRLSSTSTTTASNARGTYCTARVSDPSPPAGNSETVTIDSTSSRAPVTVKVFYQSPPGPQSYPQAGQPPVTTDASGRAAITFTVAQGSKDYPVVVEVNLASNPDACETHFVPSS